MKSGTKPLFSRELITAELYRIYFSTLRLVAKPTIKKVQPSNGRQSSLSRLGNSRQ
jgi:hypothetical protein